MILLLRDSNSFGWRLSLEVSWQGREEPPVTKKTEDGKKFQKQSNYADIEKARNWSYT